MSASAILLGGAGVCLLFISGEILIYLNEVPTPSAQLTLQILGGLYFSFSMLNWMTRSSIIGGIYNRPIAIANLTHFFIAGISIIKFLFANPNQPSIVWVIAICFIAFAISFGIIFLSHPLKD